jgi:O-antigen/teichoic acid export membrane protein
MGVVFGHSYEHGAAVLMILGIAQLINVGTGATSRMLLMTGQQRRWLFLTVLTLAVNLVLSWFLIPAVGVVGAALGSACAIGVLFSVSLYQVKQSLGVWPYDVRYSKGMLAAAVTAGVLIGISWLRMAPGGFHLVCMVGVAIGVFTVTLVILGLDAEERTLFSALLPSRNIANSAEPA